MLSRQKSIDDILKRLDDLEDSKWDLKRRVQLLELVQERSISKSQESLPIKSRVLSFDKGQNFCLKNLDPITSKNSSDITSKLGFQPYNKGSDSSSRILYNSAANKNKEISDFILENSNPSENLLGRKEFRIQSCLNDNKEQANFAEAIEKGTSLFQRQSNITVDFNNLSNDSIVVEQDLCLIQETNGKLAQDFLRDCQTPIIECVSKNGNCDDELFSKVNTYPNFGNQIQYYKKNSNTPHLLSDRSIDDVVDMNPERFKTVDTERFSSFLSYDYPVETDFSENDYKDYKEDSNSPKVYCMNNEDAMNSNGKSSPNENKRKGGSMNTYSDEQSKLGYVVKGFLDNNSSLVSKIDNKKCPNDICQVLIDFMQKSKEIDSGKVLSENIFKNESTTSSTQNNYSKHLSNKKQSNSNKTMPIYPKIEQINQNATKEAYHNLNSNYLQSSRSKIAIDSNKKYPSNVNVARIVNFQSHKVANQKESKQNESTGKKGENFTPLASKFVSNSQPLINQFFYDDTTTCLSNYSLQNSTQSFDNCYHGANDHKLIDKCSYLKTENKAQANEIQSNSKILKRQIQQDGASLLINCTLE